MDRGGVGKRRRRGRGKEEDATTNEGTHDPNGFHFFFSLSSHGIIIVYTRLGICLSYCLSSCAHHSLSLSLLLSPVLSTFARSCSLPLPRSLSPIKPEESQ